MGHHHQVPRPGPHDGLSVIEAYGNRTLPSFDDEGNATIVGRHGRNMVICRDGYQLSVIAGPGTHCLPKPEPHPYMSVHVPTTYRGPYVCFEVGRCSAPPEPWDLWQHFAIERYEGDYLYNYVPRKMIRRLVEHHGGFKRMGRNPPHGRLLTNEDLSLLRSSHAVATTGLR